MKRELAAGSKIYKKVAADIERWIELGYLNPGDKLPSMKEMAKQFGVSRPTIREALSSLQAKGLLELRQGDGTFVSRVDLDKHLFAPLQAALLIGRNDLIDLHQVRTILEVGASRWAALNRTGEAYEEIAAALTEFEWAVSDNDLVEADIRFHQAIAAATGNPVIQNLMNALTEALIDVNRATLRILPSVEVAQYYREWADAIREGRPDLASRIAEKYLDKVKDVLEKPIRTSDKPDSGPGCRSY
ncbi:FadR/GntR family transcriptional regulator [Effusibacillus lacus]|uniref:Pyruvate dehydrogenase complex repressor n=1 Tax=Effusibacillus lacus TaxID=1348429 RepID=A0A292YJM3_9BACL|nr:FadR/GntR family transcriptional regulator [Effusibacillus lacus]TCS76978.1 GntR family transcriptional regulator [Effusibacillus lacus]GAX91307.1 GntR family transcriptional regulator [Effusibacillus lacus]